MSFIFAFVLLITQHRLDLCYDWLIVYLVYELLTVFFGLVYMYTKKTEYTVVDGTETITYNGIATGQIISSPGRCRQFFTETRLCLFVCIGFIVIAFVGLIVAGGTKSELRVPVAILSSVILGNSLFRIYA